MAVKITKEPKVYSLTSPPKHPEPYPPAELIAEEMDYGDRKILVTVPFPDTIVLITDIKNEHLTNPDAKGGGAKQLYTAVDKHMMEFVEMVKKGESLSEPKPSAFGHKVVYRIPYDDVDPLNRAHLTISRRVPKATGFAVWSFRLEFSVSKAGPAGLVKLISAIDKEQIFKFSAMLPDLRLTRIDPAIDLIGASPIDLIAHIPKPGKRMAWIGATGQSESLYLYDYKASATKPPGNSSYKTYGPLRLKLYERRASFIQRGLAPPYGDCPVTRAEIPLTWTKGWPMLSEISSLPNPFEGRRVAYAAKLSPKSQNRRDWLSFCLAAFGGGVLAAQHFWPRVGQGINFMTTYQNCAGDLVSASRWDGWEMGIASTGLHAWIEAAIHEAENK